HAVHHSVGTYGGATPSLTCAPSSPSARPKARSARDAVLLWRERWSATSAFVLGPTSRASDAEAASFERCPVKERMRCFRDQGYGPGRRGSTAGFGSTP